MRLGATYRLIPVVCRRGSTSRPLPASSRLQPSMQPRHRCPFITAPPRIGSASGSSPLDRSSIGGPQR
jgi:hypothetical protein